MDRVEIHPSIIVSALLSVALIGAGILWLWFPDLVEDIIDEETGDEEEVILGAYEEAPQESLRLDPGQLRDFAANYDEYYQQNRQSFLYVTIDRPMYRPGQDVHWRSWHVEAGAFDGVSGEVDVTVELETPRGSTYETIETSRRHGMAQGTFSMDDDVPGGNWTLRITDGDQEYERTLVISDFEPPRFRKEIKFAKDAYRAGEEVSADVEILRDTGRPAAGLQVRGYAQIEGEQVAQVSVELDDNGQGEVRFTLPSAINSDDAVLVITVEERGMVETEIAPIPLALERIRLSVHPEGGRLVEGLESRVYFEATDLAGNPVEIEGYLRDGNGDKITEISTDRRGMGRFEFTPQATGPVYAIEVTEPNLRDPTYLPVVESTGCVMRLYDDHDSIDEAVRVAVWCDRPQEVGIMGAMADEVFDLVRMKAGPEEPAVAYLRPEEEWPRPAGVVRVTVLEGELREPEGRRQNFRTFFPIAERVTFRGRRNQMEIRLRPHKESYGPGEEVQLVIETVGPDGEAVAAELTRAVVDDRLHARSSDQTPSVLGRLLLEADELHFWGDVDQADRYFDLEDVHAALELDLLMGTRGWRDEEKLREYFLLGGKSKLSPLEEWGVGSGSMEVDGAPPTRPRSRGALMEEREELAGRVRHETVLATLSADSADREAGLAPDLMEARDRAVTEPEPLADDVDAPLAQALQAQWMRDDDAIAFSAWNPTLETDRRGAATDEFELSEAVGAYRIVVEGVAENGLVGRQELVIPVELPLTVALRLPEVLSGGDRIDLPVTVRNATDSTLSASVQLEAVGPIELEEPRFDVDVPPASTVTEFVSVRVGDRSDEVVIRAWVEGDGFADGAERTVRIEPAGIMRTWHASGMLPGSETHEIPFRGMTDAGFRGELLFYLNPISEALEGVESMMRRPTGCFEQTSSINHPNILVYRHLSAADQLDFEMEKTLKNHINYGYGRMMGFEIPTGGFEWFGNPPANAPLSAWGLLQFTEMSELVDDFDPDVIDRTARWLATLAGPDGTWKEDNRAWSRTRGDQRRPAELFVLYGLARAGVVDDFRPQLTAAVSDALESDRLYEVALATAALAYADYHSDVVGQAIDRLVSFQNDDGGWTVDKGSSWTFARGNALDVETTALAVLAILEGEGPRDAAARGADWLATQKTGNGWWGSTQATVLALDARITFETDGPEQRGAVTVRVGDEIAAQLEVSTDSVEPVRVDAADFSLSEEDNRLSVESDLRVGFDAELNWRVEQFEAHGELPLSLDVQIGGESAQMGDEVSIAIEMENMEADMLGMSLIRLALPAGVDVSPSVLDDLVERSAVDFYETRGREVILYFDNVDGAQRESLRFSGTAAIPGDFEVPASVAYPYYRDESYWNWTEPGVFTVKTPD